MVILDAPYVSGFLARSLKDLDALVLDTAYARSVPGLNGLALCTEERFAEGVRAGRPVYTNSENAIDVLARLVPDSELVRQCDLFKDKVRFREMLADVFPQYRFRGLELEELETVDPHSLPYPVVVKPARGFFSLGVHVVAGPEEWARSVSAIRAEVAGLAAMYPEQVLDAGRYVVEEAIQGEEYAVDVYYDDRGEPVILNVLSHLFGSAEDVSDRVYLTSADIVEKLAGVFLPLLATMGQRAGLRNFPMHAEMRVDAEGRVAPIEVNPLRFAGWCCTDLAWHAYGVNPYEYFLKGLRPDWDRLRQETGGKATALVVADLPASLDRSRIRGVDYEEFQARFSDPLELRKVDYRTYSVFAFLFARVPDEGMAEFQDMLGRDLTEFLDLA